MKKLLPVLLLFTLSSCSILRQEKNQYKPEMVSVEGGSFTFGDFYKNNNPDATPAHTVIIDDFEIGKYEVSYSQYDYFAQNTGRDLPESDIKARGNRAVTYVDWDDAKAFCEYYGFRLPSEIEWEYAARSRGKNHVVSGTTTLDSIYVVALTKDERRFESITVGTKVPNQLGIYDMSGNVFEWIGEYYQFYDKPEKKHSLNEDAMRIIRGGSFYENIVTNRTYWRTGTLKVERAEDIGFRCADD